MDMANENSRAYKLLTLLDVKALSLLELEGMLKLSDANKILTILCASMKLYIGELKNSGEVSNPLFLDHFFTTMKVVISRCEKANLGETLKAVQDMSKRCLKLDKEVQASGIVESLKEIESILMDKLDSQYQDNHYEFMSYLVYDIRSLIYIRQTLAAKPHYVNSKNKAGKHIVLELIGRYITESRVKEKSKLLSYYRNAIMTIMNAPHFHLTMKEIEEYTDLLTEELKRTQQSNTISTVSFYNELISILNKKHDDQEITRRVNDEFGITMHFSKEAAKEIASLKKKPYIITIDSEKTLDMDDALSITKIGDRYQLHIYIADVAGVIKDGSYIDREAYKRMETLYFADPIIPMLPPELSDNILSLNNNSYKPVIEGIIEIYENGDMGEIQLRQNHILVDQKCSHAQVNHILNKATITDELTKTIMLLYEVASILKKQNTRRGLYREIKDMRSSSQGIERHKVAYGSRTKAEVIIEEIMVLFNSQVARYFSMKGYPCLYRVHPGPTTTQEYNSLLQLREYIMEEYSNPSEYAKIANSLLAMYPQAYYSTRNIGHFGLDKSYYCHATSPIRRYPDIILQRLIYDYIFSEPTRNKDQLWIPKLNEMSQYCNERMDENIQYQIRMQYVRSSK